MKQSTFHKLSFQKMTGYLYHTTQQRPYLTCTLKVSYHCDLKTNSILVSNKLKFLMVFLEAKPVTYSPLVKYSIR